MVKEKTMFDAWLEQEKAAIRSRFEKIWIFSVMVAVLMGSFILSEVISILDGGGIGSLVFILFYLLIMGIAFSLGNYKKRFLKPFLASVQQELQAGEEREEFARQMKDAVCISYQPLPGIKACELMAVKEYCYMRQPRQSRILRNRQLCKIVLSKEEYMVGRGHMRWCYGLALHALNEEQPVWRGYFMRWEEAEQALSLIREVLPPDAVLQDELANPPEVPQKPWWKNVLDFLPFLIFLALMIFLAKYLSR